MRETGISLPDSAIMLELCKILGITANELLSGENIDLESYEKKADENLVAMKKENENKTAKNFTIFAAFSATLLIDIVVCLICEIAISGGLTWSLIPAVSIVFAWVITFPVIIMGKRGAAVSLLALSVFNLPYLGILSRLLGAGEVFIVGKVMAVIAVAFMWIIFLVIKKLGKARTFLSLGISFLLAIPFTFVINFALSKMISEPCIDVWDILTAFILLIAALVSFICDKALKK